jgi:hypothetical protein
MLNCESSVAMEIRVHGHAEAAAEAVAADHRNQRLRNRDSCLRAFRDLVVPAAASASLRFPELRDVGARDEGLVPAPSSYST